MGDAEGAANITAEEEKLHNTYSRLQEVHRSFLPRQAALHSAPAMLPGASATVIWMGRQYMGMEADYLELLFDGLLDLADRILSV